MGLFDFFKKDNNDEEMVKITDFFSPEDMNEVKTLVKKNSMGPRYRTMYYQNAAKRTVAFMSHPDKEYSLETMNGFIKVAETIMVMEPSLKPILEDGIARIRAYGTGEVVAPSVRKDDLMKAIDQSDLSYEEVMNLINEKKGE